MKSGSPEIEKLLALLHEGKLDDVQAGKLFSLLQDNPEMLGDDSFVSFPELRPLQMSFCRKEKLYKSISDLSDSQLEYLSVAALENDLSDQGKKELEELIEADEKRKKVFESILKTKLHAPSYGYPYKNRLKKLTAAQKTWRFSLTVLSAAAAIALFVTVMMPSLLQRNSRIDSKIPVISVADTLIIFSGTPVVRPAITPVTGLKNDIKLPEISEVVMPIQYKEPEDREYYPAETGFIQANADIIIESAILQIENIEISGLYEKSYALAEFPERLKPPVFEKNRSNVDRFVARLIHNTILKDTISVDRPVRGYDLAAASIVSINKLLGWDMALVKTNNREGELKSVYFSSAVLKFNVPVKKINPDE